MKKHTFRSLIILITLTLALSFLGTSGAQRKTGPPAKEAQPQKADCGNTNDDAATALALLKGGNQRWTGPPRMWRYDWPADRRATAECQRPWAVVITCMDSRVPPELIFNQPLGKLFVIRVAGPVLNDDAKASLEYALVEKNVKLVVVLGHTDCGAVQGAVGRFNPNWRFLPELLKKFNGAIDYVKDKYNKGQPISPTDKTNLNRVSIANARKVSGEIPAFPPPGIQVTWGLYNTGSGLVAFEPKEPWLP